MSRGKGRCFFFLLSMKKAKNPLNRINDTYKDDTSYVHKKRIALVLSIRRISFIRDCYLTF